MFDFFSYIKIVINLSAKYYKKAKKNYKKGLWKAYEDFSEEEDKKTISSQIKLKPSWRWKTKVGWVQKKLL